MDVCAEVECAGGPGVIDDLGQLPMLDPFDDVAPVVLVEPGLLANTGADPLWGLFGVVLVAAGGAVLWVRRVRRSS